MILFLHLCVRVRYVFFFFIRDMAHQAVDSCCSARLLIKHQDEHTKKEGGLISVFYDTESNEEWDCFVVIEKQVEFFLWWWMTTIKGENIAAQKARKKKEESFFFFFLYSTRYGEPTWSRHFKSLCRLLFFLVFYSLCRIFKISSWKTSLRGLSIPCIFPHATPPLYF